VNSLNTTEAASNMNWLQKYFLQCPYRVFAALFLMFIAFGFIYATPTEIAQGLWTIIISPDILVTDYITIAGLGATYVNVALSGLLSLLVMVLAKHDPNGLTLGTFGLVMGFAFFGKNPVNMLPIIFGGYLYSKIAKEPFNRYCIGPILATCLAPVVTQLAFVEHIGPHLGIAIGILLGIFIGLVINPIAKSVRVTGDGYNLYNIGFAGGLIAIGIMLVYRTLGIDFVLLSIWSEGYNLQLGIFLLAVSIYFIICGLLSNGKSTFAEMTHMKTEDVDFYTQFGGKTYINVGLMGIFCFIFMFLVQGEYNGPVIGAILSVVGFGAFGKRLLSAIPIMAGAMLAAFAAMALTGIPFNSREFLVAAIFSTCLSPLATKFGWKWGVIAGFVHLAFAVNVAIFHGGMNLYNNGLAGGLAALLLLPIIRTFDRKRLVK